MPRERAIRRGFSLLELLIVLGLFAVMASLVVFNFDNLIRSYTEKNVEVLFWDSLRTARFEAMVHQSPMFLHYDTEKATLVVEDVHNAVVHSFPTNLDPKVGSIVFHARLPSASLNQALMPEPSSWPVSSVVCTPQGFSPPIQVVITQPEAIYKAWVDPFAAAPIELKNKAPL